MDIRSWLQTSRPVVQSQLLFYSDGQFAYNAKVQDSRGNVLLQLVVPQGQSFSILGTNVGPLRRDSDSRIWSGDITLRIYGDNAFTRNWKDVTVSMERLP